MHPSSSGLCPQRRPSLDVSGVVRVGMSRAFCLCCSLVVIPKFKERACQFMGRVFVVVLGNPSNRFMGFVVLLCCCALRCQDIPVT